jgi:hypothetical protein
MSACGLILALGILPASSMAQSQPEPGPSGDPAADARARELYEKGDRFYAEGRYEKAVEAFREAYALSKRPLLQFNLANAYERLGRYEDALSALRAYQPHAPEHEREIVAKRIDSLELRAREQAAEAKPAPPPAPTTTPAPATAAARASSDPPPASPSRPIAGYVLVGTGVAFLAAGTVLAIVSARAKSDAEDECPSGICPVDAEDTIDRGRTFGIMADIGFGLGAVGVGAGVLAIALHEPNPPNRTGASSIRISPARHGAGVSFGGRF